MPRKRCLWIASLVVAIAAGSARGVDHFRFQTSTAKVVVRLGDVEIGSYVFADKRIKRPYFAHVKTPEGIQVTRNHPPQAGDAADHADFHPGLFMAFGDLSGSDNWRLKAAVVHDGFVERPQGGERGGFTVRNRYLSNQGKPICREICAFEFHRTEAGVLLIWRSTFSSDTDAFYFGDQEEMGLGLRVATPLAVRRSGRILDAAGRRNEKGVWGKTSAWCDYGGVIKGRSVGLTVMSAPSNFRPSWHHARDYGFVAANPFGRKAFTRGPASKIDVPRGETLRLQFGVLIRSSDSDSKETIQSAYEDFLARLAKPASDLEKKTQNNRDHP